MQTIEVIWFCTTYIHFNKIKLLKFMLIKITIWHFQEIKMRLLYTFHVDESRHISWCVRDIYLIWLKLMLVKIMHFCYIRRFSRVSKLWNFTWQNVQCKIFSCGWSSYKGVLKNIELLSIRLTWITFNFKRI